MADKSREASLNRTVRTGWLEHERMDRIAGEGQPRRISIRGRTAETGQSAKACLYRSACTVQVSLKVDLYDNTEHTGKLSLI